MTSFTVSLRLALTGPGAAILPLAVLLVPCSHCPNHDLLTSRQKTWILQYRCSRCPPASIKFTVTLLVPDPVLAMSSAGRGWAQSLFWPAKHGSLWLRVAEKGSCREEKCGKQLPRDNYSNCIAPNREHDTAGGIVQKIVAPIHFDKFRAVKNSSTVFVRDLLLSLAPHRRSYFIQNYPTVWVYWLLSLASTYARNLLSCYRHPPTPTHKNSGSPQPIIHLGKLHYQFRRYTSLIKKV